MAEEFLGLEGDRHAEQTSNFKIKHFLIGEPPVVRRTMQNLHIKGYCEIGDWSEPVPAGSLGEPGEVVAILVRRVQVE